MPVFVSVVKQSEPSSFNNVPRVVAICTDENAANRWIQDEVDGRHDSEDSYMKGKSSEWWIKCGYFTIYQVEVQS